MLAMPLPGVHLQGRGALLVLHPGQFVDQGGRHALDPILALDAHGELRHLGLGHAQ
jgi:hypothetical protein